MQDPNWDSTQNDDDAAPIEENFDSTVEDNSATSGATPITDQTAPTSAPADISVDPADASTGQITDLEAAQAKIAELTTISQQALADLQNFKKRSEEEKAQFIIFANATLITDLLPALDNMERALAHIPEEPAAKEWAQGILATMKQLEQILATKGLEKIESERKDFDPQYHEALITEEGEQDKVVREVSKGYKIGKRVIRRAKVAVGHGKGHPKEHAKTHEKPHKKAKD